MWLGSKEFPGQYRRRGFSPWVMDCSLPGSSIHGIFQARILEWVPCPSPGDPPKPGIEPWSPTLQADSLWSEPPGKPRKFFHVSLN